MAKVIDPSRVAIYIRWSTDDQGDGTTLQVQMEGCRAYLVSQGWTATEDLIFVDDGYSGGSLDRPAMKQMRRMIQDEEIDCVVVLKLDRLSRNVVDMVRLVIEEWGDLCYLKSAREAIDTTNHAGRMFFYTLTSFAEWERATIKDRTFSGKLKRAQEGKNPGMRAPYGYRTINGVFELVDHEAETVRQIFERYRAGVGMAQIAWDLNAAGIPHRGRPVWDKTEVQRVIRNSIYVGDFIYGARSKNPRRSKHPNQTYWVENEQPLVVCSGVIPPVVSRETWNQVQFLRASKPNPQKGQSGRALGSRYLLSGLLRCANCGGSMHGRVVTPTGIHYYVCQGRTGLGPAHCDAGYIRMDDLDDHVSRLFRQRYGPSEERDKHLHEYLNGLAGELAALNVQLHSVDEQLEKLDRQGARLRRQYREEQITIDELRTNEVDVKREMEEAIGTKDRLQQAKAGLEAVMSNQANTKDLSNSIDVWEDLSSAERKTLLRHFLSEARTYKPKGGKELPVCELVWRVVT